ncbi:MAG: peptidase S41, partial [Gammaproteobacteria bacterium]|nr:peptidase S41 [Gammaproteobacteria bacterium]
PRNVARFSESDLPGSLGNGNGAAGNGNAAPLVSAAEVLTADYPLNEALNLLKGMNILSRD